MRLPNLAALFLVVMISLDVMAQDYPGAAGCIEPLPQRLTSVSFSDDSELLHKAEEFRTELRKFESFHLVVVYIYGGRQYRSKNLAETVRKIEHSIRIDSPKISVRLAGYRNYSSADFFVLPLQCTQFPSPSSDLRIDEVELIDLPSKRLQAWEIFQNILNEPAAECAPAARAVRACGEGTEVEVFIVVDNKGRVAFAEAISAHPLNRANAAATANQYVFKPFVEGGTAIQVSGTIKLIYQNPEEIDTGH